jgi:D-methionine transport system ATP-binding protein
MNVIRSLCDRVAVLDQGRIVESGNVADVFLHPTHPTSRRFVYEDEDIEEDTLARAFAHVKGRLFRLTFRGNTTYDPVLGNIMRDLAVEFCILTGRIDRIKNCPYGQLVVSLNGERVDEALKRFVSVGVTVEALA